MANKAAFSSAEFATVLEVVYDRQKSRAVEDSLAWKQLEIFSNTDPTSYDEPHQSELELLSWFDKSTLLQIAEWLEIERNQLLSKCSNFEYLVHDRGAAGIDDWNWGEDGDMTHTGTVLTPVDFRLDTMSSFQLYQWRRSRLTILETVLLKVWILVRHYEKTESEQREEDAAAYHETPVM